MRRWVLLMAALPWAAGAQTSAPPAVIRVTGQGIVRTPPDVVSIVFDLRGEGARSDDAVRALSQRAEAIDALLAGKAEVRTGKLGVQAARDKACDEAGDEGNGQHRLSTGPCAVKGYVATLDVTARVTAVAQAGTLLGLAARLGATDPSLSDFGLRDPAAPQRAAIADAIRDARAQAEAIAAAAKVRLGRLVRVEDQRGGGGGDDIVVTAYRAAPAPVRPPIAVTLSPQPIETRAHLVVEFEVGAPIP